MNQTGNWQPVTGNLLLTGNLQPETDHRLPFSYRTPDRPHFRNCNFLTCQEFIHTLFEIILFDIGRYLRIVIDKTLINKEVFACGFLQ